MFPNETTILNFFPHMHLRGKSFEYRAVYPDGTNEVLLRVPKYDFFWQLDYKLAEPLKIPAGTTHRSARPGSTTRPTIRTIRIPRRRFVSASRAGKR